MSVSNLLVPNTLKLYCDSITQTNPSGGGGGGNGTVGTLTEVLAQGNDAGLSAIINVANPTNAQDVATKSYVDSQGGGGGSVGNLA